MPEAQLNALQRPLCATDSPADQEALARDEESRPIVTQARTLAPHRRATGLNDGRVWRDLRRLARAGRLGLLDRRKRSPLWGTTSIAALLPRHIPQHLVPLAIAPPCTDRELARMVRDGYRDALDHRGIRRVLEWPQLVPDVLQSRRHHVQQIPFPAPPPDQQPALPCDPSPLAERLAQALGPAPLLLRFRPYGEYPTEEPARWRIIGR